MHKTSSRSPRCESLEIRTVLSSISPLTTDSSLGLVGVAGADQKLIFNADQSDRLYTLDSKGAKTALPIKQFWGSAVSFQKRLFYISSDRTIASTDGTAAGTKQILIEALADGYVSFRQLINADGMLFALGEKPSQSNLETTYAYDQAQNRFRHFEIDHRVFKLRNLGSERRSEKAGNINGRWMYLEDVAGELYDLALPAQGAPYFHKMLTLPRVAGAGTGVRDTAIANGELFFARADSLGAPLGTWVSNGSAAGTRKVAAQNVWFGNSAVVGKRRYAFENEALWSYDRGDSKITQHKKLTGVEGWVVSTADRLFFIDENKIYTMKPGDSFDYREVSLLGTQAVTYSRNFVTTGSFLVMTVESPTLGMELLATDGRLSNTRLLDLKSGSLSSRPVFRNLGGSRLIVEADANGGDRQYQLRMTNAVATPDVVVPESIKAVEGRGLVLDASETAASNGGVLEYRWDLNNDRVTDLVAYTARTSISWNQLRKLGYRDGPKTFYSRVRVSTLETTSISRLISIHFQDAAPALLVTVPSQVIVGARQSLAFTLSEPGSDTISSVLVNWGDGSTTSTTVDAGNVARADHSYSSVGAKTITLTVEDEDGTHILPGVAMNVVGQQKGDVLVGKLDEVGHGATVGGGVFIVNRQNDDGSTDIISTSNTTADSRVLVTDAKLNGSLRVGKRLYMLVSRDDTDDRSLWVTDGTGKRTVMLWAHADFQAPQVAAGRVSFAGRNAYSQYDDNFNLMLTDGTVAGTFRVRTPGKKQIDAFTGDIVNYKGSTYFAAKSQASGTGVYRLSGDTASEAFSVPLRTTDVTLEANAHVMTLVEKSGFDGGFPGRDLGKSVYISTGSASGTKLLPSVFPALADRFRVERSYVAAFGNFFTVENADDELQLYATLGTESMPRKLAAPTGSAEFESLRFIRDLNGVAYFLAKQDNLGEQLWRTDGTAKGTYRLTNLWLDDDSIWTADDRYFYFTAENVAFDDRSGVIPDPTRLYRTDGTAAGTIRISDDSVNFQNASQLYPQADGTGIEFAAGEGTLGIPIGLYRIEPTAGTLKRLAVVRDIPSSITVAGSPQLTIVEGAYLVTNSAWTHSGTILEKFLWSIRI